MHIHTAAAGGTTAEQLQQERCSRVQRDVTNILAGSNYGYKTTVNQPQLLPGGSIGVTVTVNTAVDMFTDDGASPEELENVAKLLGLKRLSDVDQASLGSSRYGLGGARYLNNGELVVITILSA